MSTDESDDITNVSKQQQSTNENNASITIKRTTYNNLLKLVVASIAVATFFGGYALGNIDDNSNSNEDLTELIKTIKENELSNPPSQPVVAQPTPTAPPVIQVSLDDDPVKGNPDAPLTIVEFSDFQCPFCQRFFQQTLPLIEENYIDTGKVKFVYRDMPLYNLHPNVGAVHIASECADEQGKFWEYHDTIFENQSVWQSLVPAEIQATLKQYASDLGLNIAEFNACIQSQVIADEITKDLSEGQRYGVTGTPAFFIGNEENGFVKVVGAQPFVVFQSVIDNQINQ